MKKALIKVAASFMALLTAGCILSVQAFAASDIPDCNGDGSADLRDLLVLKKALAAEKTDSQYDLNRDGEVSAADCVPMCQYLFGNTEVHMNEDVVNDIF